MEIKKIYIASDHAGFDAKKDCIDILKNLGFEVVDLGTDDNKTSVDYPDFSKKLCNFVANEKNSYGVLVCGTGIGMSIDANKRDGIRCALCHDAFSAKMAREHNDANVLAFGARVVGSGVIKSMCEEFFNTNFEGNRHQKRLDKLGKA